MGTRMAPSYANLLMASLEKQLLETSPQQIQPLFWKCYINNIFMIWQHNNTELTNFLQHINSFHPTIKFQYETSRDSIRWPRHHHTHNSQPETTIIALHQTNWQRPPFAPLIPPPDLQNWNNLQPGPQYRRITTNNTELEKQLWRLNKYYWPGTINSPPFRKHSNEHSLTASKNFSNRNTKTKQKLTHHHS